MEILLRKSSFVAGGEGADIHVGPREQKNRTFFCDREKLSEVRRAEKMKEKHLREKRFSLIKKQI